MSPIEFSSVSVVNKKDMLYSPIPLHFSENRKEIALLDLEKVVFLLKIVHNFDNDITEYMCHHKKKNT